MAANVKSKIHPRAISSCCAFARSISLNSCFVVTRSVALMVFHLSPRAKIHAALLVFGSLTSTPSKECGRCLLTKFGLAQFTARLLVLHRWGDDGCTAF